MGYWQEVKGTIKTGVDLAIDQVKESTDTLIDKTKDRAETVKVKTQLFMKHRDLHDIMANLGDLVYDLHKTGGNLNNNEEIIKLIEKADKKIDECKKISNDGGERNGKCN